MTRSVTQISIFAASPSDVREERDALERIVQELNLTVAPSGNARLELIRWETHVRPGIANDPQEAINNQIGNACDIIVGIFWGRIGTPTPRAGSGTLEELEKAIARWESDNNSVEVMIYFKDDGISPSQSDPDQLRQLASFRASLPKRGVLYKQVTGKEFESLLRIDLTRAVTNKFEQKAPVRSQPPTSLPFALPFSDPSSTDIDQDDGIEELLSQSSADIEQAAAIIARINALTDEATASFAKHNPELEGLKRRDAIDGIAAGLQSFSERLIQETGQLGFYQERAFGALARSILMASEDDALGQYSGSPATKDSRVRCYAYSIFDRASRNAVNPVKDAAPHSLSKHRKAQCRQCHRLVAVEA